MSRGTAPRRNCSPRRRYAVVLVFDNSIGGMTRAGKGACGGPLLARTKVRITGRPAIRGTDSEAESQIGADDTDQGPSGSVQFRVHLWLLPCRERSSANSDIRVARNIRIIQREAC